MIDRMGRHRDNQLQNKMKKKSKEEQTHHFRVFCLWCLLVEFWWWCLKAGTLKCARLEFSGRVKLRWPQSRQRALEQHLRLRAPQTWTVFCASVDQYLRTMVDSSSQPTPMGIGAVMSTCACCDKAGHEKARCRFRNSKCSNCGETGHLRAMCGQREKSAGKSSPSSSSGKSVICVMCVDLLVGTQVLGLLRWNPLSLRKKEMTRGVVGRLEKSGRTSVETCSSSIAQFNW